MLTSHRFSLRLLHPRALSGDKNSASLIKVFKVKIFSPFDRPYCNAKTFSILTLWISCRFLFEYVMKARADSIVKL